MSVIQAKAETVSRPAPATPPPVHRRGPARARRRRTLTAWLFALPFVVIFAVFMVGPIVESLGMSFTDFRSSDIQTPFNVNFVGFEQYAKLLGNPEFLRSLQVTGSFVIIGIPLTIVIGLVLAVALNSRIVKFRAAFRVGFYTPVVTSIVAVAIVWRFILQPDGLLNIFLQSVGIHGPNWLADSTWALPALIIMAVWRNVGTLMIIFLAGLQNIPEDVLEAAQVDGASAPRRFFSITLPMLRPTMLLGAVLLSVGFLQFFEESYVMTQGGPLGSTLSISYFTYNQFGFGNYAAASAASYILFVIIAAVSILQFRFLRSKD
jgi:multiple sugar transport system permease protein